MPGRAACGRQRAHGMWTASLISSVLGNELPGAGTVYVRQDLRFHAPVFLGDMVTATVTVTGKEQAGNLVRFDCRCTNQNGEVVLDGTAEVRAPTNRDAMPSVNRPTFSVQTHDGYEELLRRAAADSGDQSAPSPIPATRAPCAGPSRRPRPADHAHPGRARRAKIRQAAEAHGIDLAGYEVVDAADAHEAAARAVELVRDGQGRAPDEGQPAHRRAAGRRGRQGHRPAHPPADQPRVHHGGADLSRSRLFITDAAVNIAPDLEAKVDILQNAIDLRSALGIGQPRVAILSAVETVNPKIPTTLEAAALCKMADRGQITGGLLDGPFALDNAISPVAAQVKGIKSPVAGRAKILVVPDLEAGNMLAKNLSFLANADAAGIVLGARVPIILTSRADSVRTRMASCAVAALYAHALRQAAAAVGGVARWARPSWSSMPARRASSSSCSTAAGGDRWSSSSRARWTASARARVCVAKDAEGGCWSTTCYAPTRSRDVPRRSDRAQRLAARAAWRAELPAAIGHRVVHGGPDFSAPVLIDDAVLAELETLAAAGAAAPAQQPRPDPGRSASATRSSRRSPASTPPSIAATPRSRIVTRFPDALYRRGRPPLRLPRAVLRVYRAASAEIAPGDRRGAGDRLPSGQRRFDVRDPGRPEHRQHDGLHRPRRPADGDAARPARPRRRALPDREKGMTPSGRAPPLQ